MRSAVRARPPLLNLNKMEIFKFLVRFSFFAVAVVSGALLLSVISICAQLPVIVYLIVTGLKREVKAPKKLSSLEKAKNAYALRGQFC